MKVDAGVGGDQREVLEECPGRLFLIGDDDYGLIFIKYLLVEKDLTIPELAGAPNMRYVKFFTLDNMMKYIYYSFDKPIYRQLPANFERLILVVHWAYFKDFIIQEIRGKTDLFAYQGPLDQETHNREVFPPFPNHDLFELNNKKDALYADEICTYYLFRSHQYYNLARLLIHNIRQQLIVTQGIGKMKFTIRCTLQEFLFWNDFLWFFLLLNQMEELLFNIMLTVYLVPLFQHFYYALLL
jgi:hypothetical protein